VTANQQTPRRLGNQVTQPERKIRVWDVPVRIFHWALVLLIVSQITTVSIGGNAMEYHMLGGYSILTLVLFRIIWGVAGTRHARFVNFVRSPLAVVRYTLSLHSLGLQKYPGHNPPGGWSAIAMMASVLVQAVSGLFAEAEIITTGPLRKYVSDDVASAFDAIHETNALILLTLICIHMGAVLFYLAKKKENLIAPMFSGIKTSRDAGAESLRPGQGIVRALLILIACAALVYAVVTL
jgi:cytochrome b